MTDAPPQRPDPLADAPPGSAMDLATDQAMSWLIELDGADPHQRARFDAWLAADPAHAEAFAKVQTLWGSDVVRKAASKVAKSSRPSTLRRLFTKQLPRAMAALVLVGLFNVSDLPLRLKADHVTAAGERQRLELQDGSKVLLNTRSAFSSRLDHSQQVARLYQGEAFFEVPSANGMPLQVEAGPVRMSASSTAFGVRYLDGVARIDVQRGAVNVQGTPGNAAVRLAAGESLRVGADGVSLRESSHPGRDLAWVQGRLIFDNTPISEVLAEVRRYFPGIIVSTHAQLDQVAVTGNYRLDSPLDIMQSLAQITSTSVQALPGVMILN